MNPIGLPIILFKKPRFVAAIGINLTKDLDTFIILRQNDYTTLKSSNDLTDY